MMSKINDVDVDVYGLVSGKRLKTSELGIGYKFKALYQTFIKNLAGRINVFHFIDIVIISTCISILLKRSLEGFTIKKY